jgi:NTE family protein
MTIRHLVLSGGTIWGLSMLGILQEAISKDFVKLENLQSIWMTSVGTIVGVAISLKIDSQLLCDYFVNRPWDILSKNNKHSVLEIFDQKGIIHRGFFENMFSPLFKSVDLSCDITLAELYAYNGIEIHLYTTELNQFELVDISFKTHPEWRVIDAIYASCSIPILFTPLIIENKCYIDGGFLLNYPISKCIVENPDEVFGISLGNITKNDPESPISSQSSIFDYLFSVIYNVIRYNGLFTNDNTLPFTHQIVLDNKLSITYFIEVLYNKNERRKLVEDGKTCFIHHFLALQTPVLIVQT